MDAEFLQAVYYLTIRAGCSLEKNRTSLSYIPAIGTLTRYQIWSERNGKVFTEVYSEIDPAVRKFIELTE